MPAAFIRLTPFSIASLTGQSVDLLGEAQAGMGKVIEGQFAGGVAAAVKTFADELDRDAEAKANNSAPQLPDWQGMRNRAGEEFEKIRAQAAAELAAAKAKADAKNNKVFGAPEAPPGAAGLPTQKDLQNFGSFSGSALMLGGNDGGATARIAKAAEEQKTLLDKQLKEFQDAGKGIWELVNKLAMH